MPQVDRILEFLQRLTPLTRSCLLTELERLDGCGVEMPDTADIQAKLRAEFRKDGSTQNRTNSP
jgi:transposase-like protein